MLNWITSRSISVPWPNISLRISLSKMGLMPSAMRSVALGRGEQLVGKLVAADDHAHGRLLLQVGIDHVLGLGADVGRVQQPPAGRPKQHRADQPGRPPETRRRSCTSRASGGRFRMR